MHALWRLLDSTDLLRIHVSWKWLAPALVNADVTTGLGASGRLGQVKLVLTLIDLLQMVRVQIGFIVVISDRDPADLLVLLHQRLEPLLGSHNLSRWVKASLMQTVRSIHVVAIIHLPRVSSASVGAESDSSSRSCIRVIIDWDSSLRLIFLAHVTATRLRVAAASTSTAHARSLLLWETALTLVLLDHQVDCFLCILKVEFVVIVLLLLARLFLVFVFTKVLSLATHAIINTAGRGTMGSLWFRESIDAAIWATKDLLLQLDLLPFRLGTLLSCHWSRPNRVLVCLPSLEEGLGTSSGVISCQGLGSHTVK